MKHDRLDHLANDLGGFGLAVVAERFVEAGHSGEVAFTRTGVKHNDAGCCRCRQPLPQLVLPRQRGLKLRLGADGITQAVHQ
ncbi:hypothetical protein GRI75_06425 [Altererythrobacter soli]|uniref:Uncharacterized protein n=1 Tax=Croceibacterium soli TaxID=1739690 RepID=A0A6I4US49_9SPHN|nr:hypothetical protein [Croceibacterium soli]MXP41276.1 hypothetical protein [Croceibacterium soli]